MPNTDVSKVIYGNQTLIDLTSDTVVANKLLDGYTAHGADGVRRIPHGSSERRRLRF